MYTPPFRRTPLTISLGTALALMIVVTPTQAQDDTGNDPAVHDQTNNATTPSSREAGTPRAEAGVSSDTTLESLRVVAPRESDTGAASTRLPLTARETPQSVSSISRKTIEERTLTSLDGVLRNTVGVMVGLYDSQRPIYYVRGFRIQDFQIDGLPSYDQSTNQEFDTAFYERIDVVRGANGILTGVGVPSATINMIRKRPGREFGGSIAATVGRWNHYRLEADLNAPITKDGSVRSRFVVAPQRKNGFYDRYEEDKLALMGMVEADLGQDTIVSVGYQRQNNKPEAPVWGTIPLLDTNNNWIGLPVSTSFAPSWSFWNRNMGMAFADISHQLNADWSLKASYSRLQGRSDFLATYAYGASNTPAFIDRATGSGATIIPWRSRGRTTQDALDVYATGKLHLGGQQHDLTVGVNTLYTRERSDKFTQTGGGNYTVPNVFAWDGNMPMPTYVASGAHDDTITQQAGLFASARWRLGERLSLLTGARLTNWSTRQKNHDESGAHTGTSARLKVEREFTPYLGMVYELRPDLALYASHTRIFNPQDRRDRNNQVLDPAVGSNSEIGIKTRLTDALNLNLALYQTQQDNFAVLDNGVPPRSLPDGSSAYAGVDGTKAKGFELEMNGELRPDLDFVAGVTYVKSTRNESDLLWANFPEWLVQLGADQRFSGALSPLSAGAYLNWQSEIEALNVPTSTGGTTTLKDGPRAVLDLNATWRFSDDLRLTAAITNVTDKRYWANLDYANYGEPRKFMLTLRATF